MIPTLRFGAQLAMAFLLVGGILPARAQDPPLKGLIGVRVSLTWTGAMEADKAALQTDIELQLRQAALLVLTADEQIAAAHAGFEAAPVLFAGVGGGGAAVPVIVELRERVFLGRSTDNPFMTWLKTQHLPPDEEVLNHAVPIALGGVTNLEVATWLRYGIAQAVQPESVKDIIARYAKHPYWETPAGRPIVQHWMDLEVQAAMADAQRPVRPATVRDAIKGYVDQFINEWLAANPKKP